MLTDGPDILPTKPDLNDRRLNFARRKRQTRNPPKGAIAHSAILTKLCGVNWRNSIASLNCNNDQASVSIWNGDALAASWANRQEGI
jgi:hypothetical protein